MLSPGPEDVLILGTFLKGCADVEKERWERERIAVPLDRGCSGPGARGCTETQY